MSEIKAANTPDVSAHRSLSPEEEKALEAGKSRWLPRVFQSYGTPIPELMASPLKTGLIFGLPAGIIGAGLGSAVGGAMNGPTGKGYSGLGALIGGLGAGGLAALAAGADREAKNEGLEELMRRMPEGAAKRDLLADPQYQSDFLGWDNNKIVATARARYYRPTERFSKRTEDMAGARERYNERNKTSSINQVNKEVSMSQRGKQAMFGFGVPAGALAGLVTSNKNKRLRAVGRGALKGLGSDVGSVPGALLGGGVGLAFGGPLGAGIGAGLGGLGGGYLGANTMNEVLGPYNGETDEEKLERLLAARASKGKAPMKEKEDSDSGSEENKEAAQRILNNNKLTLSEKMAAYAALLGKQAGIPSEVPAGSYAERPQLPEPTPLPRVSMSAGSPAGAVPPLPSEVPSEDSPALRAAVAEITGKGHDADSAGALIAAQSREENAKRFAAADAAARQKKMFAARRAEDWQTLKNLPGELGKRISGGLSTAGSNTYNAFKRLGNYLKPAPTKLPDPTLYDKLKPYAPYAAIGGAGLGALALADYLSRSRKKKRRPVSTNEEHDMPKAASINWYKLARERQKNASWQLARNIGTGLAQYGGAGGLLGLLTGDSENGRLRAAGRGVLKGVGTGGGAMSGAAAGARLGAMTGNPFVIGGAGLAGGLAGGLGGYKGTSYMLGPYQRQQGVQQILQQIMKSKYTPYAAAGLGAAGLLGGAAYMGSRAGKNEATKKKKPEQNSEKQSNVGLGIGAGAGLGGLAGGLYGAIAPGHEEDPMTGRRRRRSRLSGALRGLAGGAALGGGLGGAAGYLAGDKLTAVLEKFLADKQQAGAGGPKGMSAAATTQADPLAAAKAEAATPVSPVIPQGPTDANATQGAGQLPASPATAAATGSTPMGNMPSVNLPGSAMPSAAPVIPQGPTGTGATMM